MACVPNTAARPAACFHAAGKLAGRRPTARVAPVPSVCAMPTSVAPCGGGGVVGRWASARTAPSAIEAARRRRGGTDATQEEVTRLQDNCLNAGDAEEPRGRRGLQQQQNATETTEEAGNGGSPRGEAGLHAQ